MGDYRDKARIQTFNSGSLVPHDTYLNEQQDQIAAAFETSWLDIPVINGIDNTAAAFAEVQSPVPGIRGTSVTGLTEDFDVVIPGHQWNRQACDVLKARAKIEGNATLGALSIRFEDIKYSASATAPVNSTSQTIYSGAFPGAGTYATKTVDFSGTPITLTDDIKIVFRLRNQGAIGQTVTAFGAQIFIRAPKA